MTANLPWGDPFDVSKFDSPRLNHEEVEKAQLGSWPPSDDILMRLGMAPSTNEAWWRSVAGLKPPCQWNVQGARNALPVLSISATQSNLASDVLKGALHGVEQVWLEDTLSETGDFIHQPQFWCQRSPDAYIRAFGGPYVLGPKEENLKLINGAPHTALTQKMCNAHNLVYTATHLVHPAAPGFNTIIFGCNLR